MTELENLLEQATQNEKNTLIELENERISYLNKLQTLTSNYQVALKEQQKNCLESIQKQEAMWKITLQTAEVSLMQKLTEQAGEMEQIQTDYMRYLQKLTNNFQDLRNQLKEL